MEYQIDELSRIERLAKAMNEYRTGRRGKNSLSLRERAMSVAQALNNIKRQAAHPDILRITGRIDIATINLAEECPTCSNGISESSVMAAIEMVVVLSAQLLAAMPAMNTIPIVPIDNGDYAIAGITYRTKTKRTK